MKSIAYAMVVSTALVMGCFAPRHEDQVFASIMGGVATVLLLHRKD